MHDTCPNSCKCSFDRSLDTNIPSNIALPVIVNCQNQKMSRLPTELPPFTKRLDVSGNKVTYLTQHFLASISKPLIIDLVIGSYQDK